MPKPRYHQIISDHAWRLDGKPDRDPYEPTTVGRHDYDEWTTKVLEALDNLGFMVVRKEDW